jgi:hypothetical protein
MDSEATCFGKLVDIITGTDIYLRQIPCVLGRVSNSDNMNAIERKNLLGKTIDIDLNYCNVSELNDYCVKYKLVIEKCKRMY